LAESDLRDLEAYRLTRSLVVDAYAAFPDADRVLERAAVRAALHLVDGWHSADLAERRRHLEASLEAVVDLRRRLEELRASGHLAPAAAVEMLDHQRRTEELLLRAIGDRAAD
jgi:hypothetical protein